MTSSPMFQVTGYMVLSIMSPLTAYSMVAGVASASDISLCHIHMILPRRSTPPTTRASMPRPDAAPKKELPCSYDVANGLSWMLAWQGRRHSGSLSSALSNSVASGRYALPAMVDSCSLSRTHSRVE